MRVAAALAAAALVAAVTRMDAQDPGPMVFEVASVKPNKSGPAAGQFLRGQPGGVVQVGNMTARDLITWAYQIQGFQLVGGPEWLPSDRFDITASAGRELPATGFGAVAPAMLMMRALLAERFGLAVHGETRELPIYALVLARADGRLGAGLRRSATDCAALVKAAAAAGTQPVPPPPGPDGRPRCGLTGRSGAIMAGGYPLSQFTRFLAPQVQRVVVDRTGLTGDWDIDLAFTPPQAAGSADASASDPNSAALFTALQEQLGLKLEAARGPVDVLVIDRVARPTPD
jgi:uncharacterized protein (TIGR03435 family)